MDMLVWIVLAVVAVAVAVWFFTRKPAQLPPPGEQKELPSSEAKPAELERPAAQEPAAVSERPAPVSEKPARVSEKPAPVAEKPAPVSEKPAPVSEKPAPVAEKPAPVAEKPAPVAEKPAKPKDLGALRRGLSLTRGGWMQRLFEVFSGRKEIDPALLDEIEETLLTGDVGATTTKRLVDGLKERMGRKELADADRVWAALEEDALAVLDVKAPAFGHSREQGKPFVLLMAGVNGAGKTTTIAKLAQRYKEEGRSVLLAAGDTFRAAAVAQLEMWGKRVGVPVHRGKDGAKPGAVVYEAVARGVAEKVDVIIADTAGRLQTKAPLMEELRKIREACGKALPGAPHEVLLVLDATTGQNAISQAREFRETLDLTGVVLTKLDGTAKGGVILAVAEEFKLPVRFIGVGEKSDDLREFDAKDFVEALFARGDEASDAS